MAKTFPGFDVCDLTCHVIKCSVLCQERSQMAKTFPGFDVCDLTCHILNAVYFVRNVHKWPKHSQDLMSVI